jgi:hypothetical protein
MPFDPCREGYLSIDRGNSLVVLIPVIMWCNSAFQYAFVREEYGLVRSTGPNEEYGLD